MFQYPQIFLERKIETVYQGLYLTGIYLNLEKKMKNQFLLPITITHLRNIRDICKSKRNNEVNYELQGKFLYKFFFTVLQLSSSMFR